MSSDGRSLGRPTHTLQFGDGRDGPGTPPAPERGGTGRNPQGTSIPGGRVTVEESSVPVIGSSGRSLPVPVSRVPGVLVDDRCPPTLIYRNQKVT